MTPQEEAIYRRIAANPEASGHQACRDLLDALDRACRERDEYHTMYQRAEDLKMELHRTEPERARDLAEGIKIIERERDEAQRVTRETLAAYTRDAADSYAASLATVTAERDEALGWKPLAMSEGKRADATRAMLDVIEARLSTERDTAEAALAALRQAAGAIRLGYNGGDALPVIVGAAALGAELAATPADLAARVRARVLREVARTIEQSWGREVPSVVAILAWLRDEAKKGGTP